MHNGVRYILLLLRFSQNTFSWFYLTLFNSSGRFGHTRFHFQHCLLYCKVSIFPTAPFSPQLHFPHSCEEMVFELKGNDFRTGWKCKFDQILWTMLSSTKIEDLKVERVFARAGDWTHDLPVQIWALYRLSYWGNCYLVEKTGSLYIAILFLD